MIIPEDILNKINKLYSNSSDREIAQKFIESLWGQSLNVGPEQLARSILIISDGDLSELKRIFETRFLGDPRDVITMAKSKIHGHGHGHYFTDPFKD